MRRLTAAALLLTLAAVTSLAFWAPPPAARAQAVDVYINVTGGEKSKKLNIAVPDFTLLTGTDTALAKLLASVVGNDLTLSGFFSVVAATGSIPANNPAALAQTWSAFATAGAHAGVHGLLSIRGDRLEAEMRLYDLTTPEHRLIASRKFESTAPQSRRLAHKIADEIVLQFTGEQGVADTKLAYVVGPPGSKEIVVADYDGAAAANVTRNASINLSPVWSPDARSIAFTSFMNGYPDLFRLFPFERQRPVQTLASFVGINSSPGWSPDGRYLALTLSKDGNPEVYVLTLATGVLQRLTRHAGIDTEPTWSPSGQQIAFVSDRAGQPRIFRLSHAAALVAEGRSHHLHAAVGNARPLGDQPRRLQPAPAHERPGRQSRRDLGARRTAPRVPVEPHRSLAIVLHVGRRSDDDTGHARDQRGHKSLLVASPAVIGLGPES